MTHAVLPIFGEVSVVTILCVTLLLLLVLSSSRRRSDLPPGPPALPIIGNLMTLLTKDFLVVLRNLRKRYGEIYGLYIGSEFMVFLNGYDVIHEALMKNRIAFGRRPMTDNYQMMVNHPGILSGNGPVWKVQKKFAQDALNKICFTENGRTTDDLMRKEATNLVAKLTEMDGPIVIDDYLSVSMGNVMTKLLIDHRFEFGDDKFLNALAVFPKEAETFGKMQITANCFPYLLKVPGDWLNLQYLDKIYDIAENFFKPFYQKHRDCSEDNGNTDLVAMYIARQKRISEPKVPGAFSDDQLQATCSDLLGASVAGLAATIRWLILYLIKNPEVQKKMYAEISREIGTTPPSLTNRKSLVYTEAVILECMRVSPVAPLAVPHGVSQDMLLRNYHIPHKCTVIVNLESALKDPNVWDSPDEFRPERFLSNNGTELYIPTEFIPFSMGARACIGESLTRMQLFVFITSLVQAFEFQFSTDDGELPDCSGTLGLAYAPKSFPVRFVKR